MSWRARWDSSDLVDWVVFVDYKWHCRRLDERSALYDSHRHLTTASGPVVVWTSGLLLMTRTGTSHRVIR